MLVFDLQGGHSSQWHEGARLTSAAASSWEAVSAKRRGSCQEPLGGQQAAVETTLPSPPPPSLFLSLPRLSACPSLPISVSVSLSLSLSLPPSPPHLRMRGTGCPVLAPWLMGQFGPRTGSPRVRLALAVVRA